MSSFTNVFRVAFLAAAAGLLALGVMVGTPSGASAAPASEAPSAARNYYGSVAIAADKAWGSGYNYATARGAQRRAKAECKERSTQPRTCTVVGWVSNGCAAVGIKVRNGQIVKVTWGYARTLAAAKRSALRKIGPGNKRINGTVCTRR